MVRVLGPEWPYILVPKIRTECRSFWDCFQTVPTSLWTAFGRSGAELLCLFWAVLRRIVELLIGLCVLFGVIAKDE